MHTHTHSSVPTRTCTSAKIDFGFLANAHCLPCQKKSLLFPFVACITRKTRTESPKKDKTEGKVLCTRTHLISVNSFHLSSSRRTRRIRGVACLQRFPKDTTHPHNSEGSMPAHGGPTPYASPLRLLLLSLSRYAAAGTLPVTESASRPSPCTLASAFRKKERPHVQAQRTSKLPFYIHMAAQV